MDAPPKHASTCETPQDLDDQLDAADEELSFIEGELVAAERATLKGDGLAALELRRHIAGLKKRTA